MSDENLRKQYDFRLMSDLNEDVAALKDIHDTIKKQG